MSCLYCLSCNKIYNQETVRWQCECGGLLDIKFHAVFDISKITARKPNMWRYREMIPIACDDNIVSFDEGFTPLLEIKIGGRNVLVKQDHLFPSGSYKDRGSSVLISKVKELGIKHVVEDSSGNAGSSIAAYCAMAEIECDIFVPQSTSPSKLKQIEAYHAKLHMIKGNREKTAKAAIEAAGELYFASHCWNPFFFQGTKTFAYEICEQLDWSAPHTLVLPAGNGTLVLGAYIGFNELLNASIIDSLPKLIIIQTENCAPLYHRFHNKKRNIPYLKTRSTIAEGIAIAKPIRGNQILEAIKNTDGDILTVSENEIQAAIDEMHNSGYYIEPTSGATIAGLKKYLSKTPENELVVSVFTGHGLQ